MFGRNVLHAPINGVIEMIEISMIAIVFLQLADATRVGRLTRSDGFFGLIQRKAPRLGFVMGSFFDLLGALMMFFILYGTWPSLIEAWTLNDYIGNEGVFTAPKWPMIAILILGSFITLLLFVKLAVTQIRAFNRGRAAAMTPFEIGIASVVCIVVMIYAGLYIPVALGLVSFLGVWIIRDNIDIAINMLALAAADTVSHQVFATVPLFAMMGLIVSKAGLGNDVYKVANFIFYKVRGGLGIATVAANAVFAAITGSSIASASVFARVSVPEMRKFGYTTRFSVGVVAGSSVLGMIIPPSAMLIIYAITADQSVGQLFLAGIIPGVLLAVAFALAIVIMARFWPKFVGGHGIVEIKEGAEDWQNLSWGDVTRLMAPIVFLVLVVLGGIYGGIVTPVEAGAAGSLVALLIAIFRRAISWRGFWDCLVETGHITASILFLIVAASMYSRMLGFAGLPTLFQAWLDDQGYGCSRL